MKYFRFPLRLILALGLGVIAASADWRDEIGLARLQLLASEEIPNAPLEGLSQVEAEEAGTNYKPDTANLIFTGKTFTDQSGISGVSGHATTVASFFYGLESHIPGACGIDLYRVGGPQNANGWLNSDFLRQGTNNDPLVESRAVQNHSWIGAVGGILTTARAAEYGRRLDLAIHRDGFVSVVGVNNGSSNPLPALLCQTYNTISVGRTDGNHSAGLTTIDGSNRMKPDIVAPESATSWTTPMVAGAAGILHEKLRSSESISGADLPRVVKALLLATATKDTVPGWDNTPGTPLDSIYGAGGLNVFLAYSTLRAGEAVASNSTQYSSRGWAAEPVTAPGSKTYYFNLPGGASTTPFCAALTWHRLVNGNWSNPTSTLRDLSLRLYHANGFTLGSEIAASTSAVDNVELIHQAALPAGDYALQVTSAATQSTDFALAWHGLPSVTVATAVSSAREIDGQAGQITLQRTGDTSLPLLVPISVTGTAVPGIHYLALPASVTIPSGSLSSTLQITPISDSMAQGDRSVIVAVAADFTLVRNTTQNAEVTILDKPFDSWRFENFTAPQLAEPTTSGETADPDGDGVPNLVEYALGTLPNTAGPSPQPQLDSNGHLSISAAKNPAATDIIWGAQVTEDLLLWVPALITESSSDFAARDSISMDPRKRRFIRLRITR